MTETALTASQRPRGRGASLAWTYFFHSAQVHRYRKSGTIFSDLPLPDCRACDRFCKAFMALILGFLTLPLPAPSAKSILQSRSASHISAAATTQMSIPDLKKLSHHCFPASRGKAPARIARMHCIEHRAFGIEHLDFGT